MMIMIPFQGWKTSYSLLRVGDFQIPPQGWKTSYSLLRVGDLQIPFWEEALLFPFKGGRLPNTPSGMGDLLFPFKGGRSPNTHLRVEDLLFPFKGGRPNSLFGVENLLFPFTGGKAPFPIREGGPQFQLRSTFLMADLEPYTQISQLKFPVLTRSLTEDLEPQLKTLKNY